MNTTPSNKSSYYATSGHPASKIIPIDLNETSIIQPNAEEKVSHETKLQRQITTDSEHLLLNYFWNERLQLLLENPVITPEESKTRLEEIYALCQQFTQAAEPLAKQIILEHNLPYEQKTIKPIDVGGVAGGIKYVTKHFFFKLACNSGSMIYDSAHWAQKTVNHELKSLNKLISMGIHHLHFPLVCTVSFLGYKVLAMCKLPLNENTLVLGSSNGSSVIYDKSIELKRKVMEIAERLNLKKHQVVDSSKKVFEMYSPIDLEGHEGADGRFYVVDYHRLFPPVKPINCKGSHLYRLFRPEFLERLGFQLSPNAYSSWNIIGAKKNDKEIDEATLQLENQAIPHLISYLNTETEKYNVDITQIFHDQGVNLRYLGKVVPRISGVTRCIILIEILARAFKAVLSHKFRTLAEQIISNSVTSNLDTSSFIDTLRLHLDLLFGNSENSATFWSTEIAQSIQACFPIESNISCNETTFSVSARQELLLAISPQNGQQGFGLLLLLQRICTMNNITLNENVLSQIQTTFASYLNGNSNSNINQTLFSENSIMNLTPKVKQIEIHRLSEAKSNPRIDFQQQCDYQEKQVKLRKHTLGDDHLQVGISYMNLGDLYSSDMLGKEKAEIYFKLALDIFEKKLGKHHYELSWILEKIASFYLKFGKLYEAESKLRQALSIHETHLKIEGQFDTETLKPKIEILSPQISNVLAVLTEVCTKQGKLEEALQICEQSLQIRIAYYGSEHFSIGESLNNKGHLLILAGRYTEAVQCLQDALIIYAKTKGTISSGYGVALDNLGKVYMSTNQYQLAEYYFEHSFDVKKQTLGENHHLVATTLNHLGMLASQKGDLAITEEEKRQCYTQAEVQWFIPAEKILENSGSTSLGVVKYNLGKLYQKCGFFQLAQDKYYEAETILNNSAGVHVGLENLAADIAVLQQQRDDLEGFSSQRDQISEIWNIPPAWKSIFDQLGIKEDQLRDPILKTQLLQIIVDGLQIIDPSMATPKPDFRRPNFNSLQDYKLSEVSEKIKILRKQIYKSENQDTPNQKLKFAVSKECRKILIRLSKFISLLVEFVSLKLSENIKIDQITLESNKLLEFSKGFVTVSNKVTTCLTNFLEVENQTALLGKQVVQLLRACKLLNLDQKNEKVSNLITASEQIGNTIEKYLSICEKTLENEKLDIGLGNLSINDEEEIVKIPLPSIPKAIKTSPPTQHRNQNKVSKQPNSQKSSVDEIIKQKRKIPKTRYSGLDFNQYMKEKLRKSYDGESETLAELRPSGPKIVKDSHYQSSDNLKFHLGHLTSLSDHLPDINKLPKKQKDEFVSLLQSQLAKFSARTLL